MAKIISPVWSYISGSIAGTTYLTTQAGAIIGRQRVKPVNRRSTHQTQVRSSLGGASATWRDLLPSVQSDWNMYALTAGYRTGREAFVAGFVLASYLNARFTAGIPMVATRPAEEAKFALLNFNVVPTTTVGTGVDVIMETDESNSAIAFIQASPGFAPSRRHWTGPWDPLKGSITPVIPAGTTTKQILGTKGLRYFCRLIVVEDELSLRVSSPWIGSAIAAEVLV